MKTTNADRWFSRYIRLRDADENGYGRCFTCGTLQEVKYMDCGHFVKRQYSATRYNEINCQLQCKRCNAFEQGKDSVFRAKLVEKYGEDKIMLLEASKRQTQKRTKQSLHLIAMLYKDKTGELLKQKGLTKWW